MKKIIFFFALFISFTACSVLNKDMENQNKENDINVYAGGVVGYNNEMLLQNSYANVVFENRPEEQEKNMKAYGAVAGYIGNSKTYYQLF